MIRSRVKVSVSGAVQGVGFRPFVYRLASELKLAGWVANSGQGLSIEAEGEKTAIDDLLRRLDSERPANALIHEMQIARLEATNQAGPGFEIRHGASAGIKSAAVLPDLATCGDCLKEIFDPGNRRFRYPFTNCTNCGPRYTIIDSLPYERENTSMRSFDMCSVCFAEYANPEDRRFHAQPNACPNCGPQLELWNSRGKVLSRANDALLETAAAIRDGAIVALKGIGGFQLLVDARKDAAVLRLRERKRREEKPFAIMCNGLEGARRFCSVTPIEARLLESPQAPIVLLPRIRESSMSIASEIAPENPWLGVMLPYSPLHHLLLAELRFPVVATSGNLAGEPICTDEQEALERLQDIADFLLVHNRPILRHVDDSIARVINGEMSILRRARGYAPLPLKVKKTSDENSGHEAILACGAQQKNSIALAVGSRVFISQHIGDLETAEAAAAFRKTARDLPRLYSTSPGIIVCDLHPDYYSSSHARDSGREVLLVQHHHAHVLACMAENNIDGPVLGVAWDGSGYGTNGTIWGGEFLKVNDGGFERVAHLRTFQLPGGESAVREPRRAAAGLLWEIFGDEAFERDDIPSIAAFPPPERDLLRRVLRQGINAPRTSSAGRLFDAVASITGLRQKLGFEGQAAMALEFSITAVVADYYSFEITHSAGPAILDCAPMLREILSDVAARERIGHIAAKFHNTLSEMIVRAAREIGESRVVLTGGCFQNKTLTERTIARLREEGFEPFWHRLVPTNDGGICLGQAAAALRTVGINPVAKGNIA